MMLLALQVLFIGPDAVPWKGDPLPRPHTPVTAYPEAKADPGPLVHGSGSATYYLPRVVRPIALVGSNDNGWLSRNKAKLNAINAAVYCVSCDAHDLERLRRIYPYMSAINGAHFADFGITQFPAVLFPEEDQ